MHHSAVKKTADDAAVTAWNLTKNLMLGWLGRLWVETGDLGTIPTSDYEGRYRKVLTRERRERRGTTCFEE